MLLNLTYVKIVLSKFTYPLKTKSRQSLAGMLVPHRSSVQMFSIGSCSRANLWLYGCITGAVLLNIDKILATFDS